MTAQPVMFCHFFNNKENKKGQSSNNNKPRSHRSMAFMVERSIAAFQTKEAGRKERTKEAEQSWE